MTNIVSFDELKAKADAEYAPYRIEMPTGTLTLLNPMRIEKAKRERVSELKDELNAIKEDLEAKDESEALVDEDKIHGLMLEMISLCGDNEMLASELNDELRKDIGLTQVLFYDWLGTDEVGEASNSAD